MRVGERRNEREREREKREGEIEERAEGKRGIEERGGRGSE